MFNLTVSILKYFRMAKRYCMSRGGRFQDAAIRQFRARILPPSLHLSPAVTLGVSGDRSGGRSRKNILRSVGAAARAEGGVELQQFLPRLLTLGCLLAGEGCNDLWHTRLCGDSMEAMRPVSIVSTVYWTYFQQNNSRSSF